MQQLVVASECHRHLPSLLRELAMVSLPSLKWLNLNHNMLESVEAVVQLSMPGIEVLSLAENSICSIRGVRKADWPCLAELYLSSNASTKKGTPSANARV